MTCDITNAWIGAIFHRVTVAEPVGREFCESHGVGLVYLKTGPPGMEKPRTRAELDALGRKQYVIGSLLTSDQTELLLERVCEPEVSRVEFTEDDRPSLEGAVVQQLSPSWFDPGIFSLSVTVVAADKGQQLERHGFRVRSAASFLASYIRQPRRGFDLQRERLVQPKGWERATTWYGRSVSEADYASMLVKAGWRLCHSLLVDGITQD